tara:strand:- start:300 stop:572 length:273 start_codon:yes stop_codon:yes gene_type:complete
MTTLKNLLNKSILKNLNNWKITHKKNNHTIYLTSAELKNFMFIQNHKLLQYTFVNPAKRKAERVENILNYFVLFSAIFSVILVIVNTINF